jgi:hypothetical protein
MNSLLTECLVTPDRFGVITPDGLLNKFTLDGVLSHSSNQENSTIKSNTECIKNMLKLDWKGERTETKLKDCFWS